MVFTPQAILMIILALVIAGFVFDTVLTWLNLRSQPADIPDSVAAFYDRSKYRKSLEYHKHRTNFSFVTSTFSFLLSVLMLYFGGFGWLDSWLRPMVPNEILLALVFFGVLAIASDILTLPFQIYSTFVIEEKYGFNKTTVKTFIGDKLKGYLVGAILGGGLVSLLIYLIEVVGPDFWILFSLLAAILILLINMFYTTIFLPLFNKLTPLADGELKTAIESFSKRVGFPLDNVFVMDGSKRSNKANAFFSGIGRKKKIVLYDTLINNHSTEELVAVLAHEVGHYKKKHIIFGYVLSVIQVLFTLFILSRMVQSENVSLALGGIQSAVHLNLLAFGILFSPISGLTGLFMSMYSRRNEYEADAYAKETFSGAALASALKKLSVDNLSDLYPHPLYVFFHYSHPPLLQRLAVIEKN
ncbi:MAG: M48 family metallopeptidase [Cyclobacteriaceae bacterium]|nr:M48 family metallopeptidase [Cyclobacteriaceae bacterium]